MLDNHSSAIDLPRSCRSAADHIARELAKEDAYAELTEACRQKLTAWEQILEKETGEKIALVAYRV